MDRSRVEALLASAQKAEIHTVVLPDLGETLHMRRPTKVEATRVMAAAGVDDDQMAKMMVGALKFAAVTPEGDALLRSFKEAEQLVNALSDDDTVVLFEKLGELLDENGAEDPEAGKAP